MDSSSNGSGAVNPNLGNHPLNVYIAGLPSLYNDRSLRMLFEPFGTIVSAKMMCTSTRQPNRVKGTGFVLFETETAATAAISSLNGTLLEGDPIQVRLAKVANHAPRHQAPPLAVPQYHQPQFVQSLGQPNPHAIPLNAPVYLGNASLHPTLAQFHQQPQPQQGKVQPMPVYHQQHQQHIQVQHAPHVHALGQQPQGQHVFLAYPQQGPQMHANPQQNGSQPQVIVINQGGQPQPQQFVVLQQ